MNGRARLWGWFGLSYASFLVWPRVLMHEMPDDWQDRMATLCKEYDEAFPNQPDVTWRVTATDNGRIAKMQEWMTNYRYPNRKLIDTFRKTA